MVEFLKLLKREGMLLIRRERGSKVRVRQRCHKKEAIWWIKWSQLEACLWIRLLGNIRRRSRRSHEQSVLKSMGSWWENRKKSVKLLQFRHRCISFNPTRLLNLFKLLRIILMINPLTLHLNPEWISNLPLNESLKDTSPYHKSQNNQTPNPLNNSSQLPNTNPRKKKLRKRHLWQIYPHPLCSELLCRKHLRKVRKKGLQDPNMRVFCFNYELQM